VQKFLTMALVCLAISLSGCGGGGSSGESSNGTGSSGSTPTTPPVATTPALPATSTTPNVVAVTVDFGPSVIKDVNVPFVSVTVCAPGSSTNCQTIDHILVDTGSNGLRLMASVLSPALTLPQQTSNGSSVVECEQFVDGYSWGPVKLADVKLAGEKASAIPIQIIGDSHFPNVPASCSSIGPAENTVNAFGANGVLGIGTQLQDCGTLCAQNANIGLYFSCTGSATCQPIALPVTQQVQNPVAMFATDNNGVVLKMGAISSTGAASASGSLIFGIDTQANNALGSASVYTVTSSGRFTTIYNNRTMTSSFIDSGSNAYFFTDASIPSCQSGFYCPSSTRNLTAVTRGVNGTSSNVNFTVGNADSVLNQGGVSAWASLGASNGNSNSFDWGLPFFFGRTVFSAIEGMNSSGGVGPYYAY
jgi:Protein of unknown function (DUF3443)